MCEVTVSGMPVKARCSADLVLIFLGCRNGKMCSTKMTASK